MNKPSGNAETVYQTEAQWIADTRVFGADVVAVTVGGPNDGKHKFFRGTGRWTTLGAYIEDGGGGAVTSPKVYLAKCTQTGTDAPVAAIIKNTLGVVPVWTYSGGGTYIATSAGAFPAAKTEVVLSSAAADGDYILFTGNPGGTDTVAVVNATGVDESTFTIHISVYP